MKRYLITSSKVLAAILVVFTIQLTSAISAFASDAPVDLSVAVTTLQYRMMNIKVCNEGSTSHVTGFTFSKSFTDFTPTLYLLDLYNSSVLDQGEVDPVNGDWSNGDMAPGHCVTLLVVGDSNVPTGATMSGTATLTSSVLGDSTSNIDPNSANDTASTVSPPRPLDADMKLDLRLLTPGIITASMPISYEMTISNIGDGEFQTDPTDSTTSIGVYFLMPTGATMPMTDPLLDLDTDDILDATGCSMLIPEIHDIGPQFVNYFGSVINCNFELKAGTTTVPPRSEYKFAVNMNTTASFESGVTQVRAVLPVLDVDSWIFIVTTFQNGNFLDVTSNNVTHLTFDSTELIPTINGCEGQGEVVTSNEACFNITFNKTIYSEEFTVEDLKLTGAGTVTSFSQTSPGVWTVHITGMTPGSTLTVDLKQGSISDLSAVKNGATVLGINTVRYAVPATGQANSLPSADSGSLPVTGVDSSLFLTALVLMLIGLGLKSFGRHKVA